MSRVPIVLQAQLVPATGLRQKVDKIQAALEIALPAGRLPSIIAAANGLMGLPAVGTLPEQANALLAMLGEL
jgi:hypothetical protein